MKQVTGIALCGLIVTACVVGPGLGQRSLQSEAPPARVEEPPQRIATGAAAHGQADVQRRLRQPATPRLGLARPDIRRPLLEQGTREEALAARAELRAYEGAPPVMPHSAQFGEGSKDCLDCHTLGMQIGERLARPMSHEPLVGCVQCHVESERREFAPPELTPSSFLGLRSRRALSEFQEPALTGKPPTIPHDISMRGQCLSCHGAFGYTGLRTTHPERLNCVQCHVTEDPPSFLR